MLMYCDLNVSRYGAREEKVVETVAHIKFLAK